MLIWVLVWSDQLVSRTVQVVVVVVFTSVSYQDETGDCILSVWFNEGQRERVIAALESCRYALFIARVCDQ